MRLGVLGLVWAGAVACSSSSTNEVPPVDSGSDAGSEAGDGGTEAAPACTDDPDCDDGDVCNGKETCSGGVCVAGQAPCTTPDPDHCEATCDASSGTIVCGVQGRDADGDTHRDALCAQSPGTDCDDDDASVFPGANESCDGVDSNCNGVDDIDEPGFSLSGSPFVIAAVAGKHLERPRAVWAEGAKQFGVVWTEAEEIVMLQRLDPAGAKLDAALKVNQQTFATLYPNIASDGQRFGIVWWGNSPTQIGGFFRTANASGAFVGTETAVYSGSDDTQPSVAADGLGFVPVWQADDSISARRLTTGGSLSGALAALGPNGPLPRIVAWGSGFLAVWTGADGASANNNVVRYNHLDGGLISVQSGNIAGPAATSVNYLQPVATQVGTNAFIAWRAAETGKGSLQVAELATTGGTVCGPVDVGDHDPNVMLGGAAVSGDNRLVSVVDSLGANARVRLARFGPNCERKEPLNIPGGPVVSASAPPESAGTFTDVAVGDDSILVVWQERAGNDFVIKGRVFGKNFCD